MDIKVTFVVGALFAVCAIPVAAIAQVAHVDPDSGALTESAPSGAAAALGEAAPAGEPARVVDSPVPGGGIMIRLDQRFVAVAETGPDGKSVRTECVPAAKAAAIAADEGSK